MDRFGEHWRGHPDKIARAWTETVGADDLVLVTGDISWAMRLEEARPDLEFLGALPGRKVLVKGNHDYWWSAITRVREALPPGMLALQGDAVRVDDVVLAGTRLWDAPDLTFGGIIAWSGKRISRERTVEDEEESRRRWRRELGRLDRALAGLEALCAAQPPRLRVVLTHYPPCGPSGQPSAAARMIEEKAVDHVVFGHLHAVRRDLPRPPFGRRGRTLYHLASCDYVDFRPVPIAQLS